VSGSPSSPYTFTLTADDGNGGIINQPYTITITPTTVLFAPTTLPNTIENLPAGYNQTITMSGGTGPYSVCISAGTLPAAGLTTNPVISTNCAAPTTGLTSFAVVGGGAGFAPNGNGAANFTFQETDTLSATGTQAYTVNVAPPPVLTLTTTPAALPDRAPHILRRGTCAVTVELCRSAATSVE
jgi:hypothetical protein